jgi:Domain of unknown function (DUF4136)
MPRLSSRKVRCLRASLAPGLILAIATTSGCVAYPDSEESYDDDIVVTGYDKKVAFEDYKTFAIDPVVHIIKLSEVGDPEVSDLDPKYADPIIAETVKNMEDRGYQQVESSEDPDLGISITGLSGVVTGTVSYWYGYYGYYGGYWGYPGYGYYYPYTYAYAYRTGSLITEMVELKGLEPPPEDGDEGEDGENIRTIPVAWASVAYQVLLDDGAAANTTWAKSAINQAFKQSPYLGSE